ncbi:MotA/TolQ/ExbB proton channel family protein [uncultured Methylobacterium sp.]|uniref:MotA/TolQ/ExbB proton channel family protein n=1 Tax=uncultured Methylobacterium sp. TaxID=157278 RepID=UPI0035CBED4E
MRPETAALAAQPAAGTAQHLRPRLTAYTVGLCVALGFYLLVHGRGQGVAFWACALGVILALVSGVLSRAALPPLRLRLGACGSVALALVVPMGLAAATGAPAAAALPLWPQILVTLFASHVLSEECDLRFCAFWEAPLQARANVQIQSGAAAVALGAFLTLLLYQVMGFTAPERSVETTLSTVLAGALAGGSAIHRAIVFLFFVIMAHLWEAVLRHRRDRAALHGVQAAFALLPASGRATGLQARVDEICGAYGRTWTASLIAAALEDHGTEARRPDGGRRAAAAFEAFRQASRRFVRGLITLLPLLGFLGTVVGLATAMASLPLDGAAGGRIDLTGSLAGLALKFETTLLGLLGSMAASLFLSLIEKSEAELAAACAVFAGTIEAADAA